MRANGGGEGVGRSRFPSTLFCELRKWICLPDSSGLRESMPLYPPMRNCTSLTRSANARTDGFARTSSSIACGEIMPQPSLIHRPLVLTFSAAPSTTSHLLLPFWPRYSSLPTCVVLKSCACRAATLAACGKMRLLRMGYLNPNLASKLSVVVDSGPVWVKVTRRRLDG